MVILPLPRLPPPLLASQSHLNTVHPSQPPSPRSQQPPNLKQRTQTWRRREGSLSLASPHPDNYREQAERVEVNQQTTFCLCFIVMYNILVRPNVFFTMHYSQSKKPQYNRKTTLCKLSKLHLWAFCRFSNHIKSYFV